MEYTPIHNRFWSDGWIRQLNALDRYLFLYLLTNGRAKLTGIYELPLDLMASESGIDERDLRQSMLQRLEPKVYYKEGWVIIVNYPKHRVGGGHKYNQGVKANFDQLPDKIRAISKDYGYPMHTLSMDYQRFPIRIDKNIIDTSVATAPPKSILEGKSPNSKKIPPKKKVTPEMQEVFELFQENPAKYVWNMRTHEREAAAVLHREFGIDTLRKRYAVFQQYRNDEMCPQIHSPAEFLEKMPKMEKFLANRK